MPPKQYTPLPNRQTCSLKNAITFASQSLLQAEDSTTRSLFVSFAVSFAEVQGDCSCDSRKCIAIACADHWFYCDRVVRFAEVVAVAVRDLAESLQSLYAITAGSSWLIVRAHGIVAIASAICGIPCGHILRLAEFIAIAFCEVADT